jgi:hypothetical protein
MDTRMQARPTGTGKTFPTELLDRFVDKIEIRPDGCWGWMAARKDNGYGSFGTARQTWYAHRFAYEWLVGPIPEGLEIDHLCRVRECVNPAHLEAVTHRENIRRGESGSNYSSRTHCKYGHPFDGENLMVRSEGYGRRCRICARRHWRESKRRTRRAAALSKFG